MQCMGFLLKGFFCVAENIMAGSRGQFFTVSEALQAILDKDSDCEEHTWDEEDEVDISPTTTLPLSPVPSTSAVVQEETGPRSSTPSTLNHLRAFVSSITFASHQLNHTLYMLERASMTLRSQ